MIGSWTKLFYINLYAHLWQKIEFEVENIVVSFKDDILKQCRDTYENNCTDELALCEKRNKTDNPSLKQQLENEDKEIQKRCTKNCQFMTGLFKLNVF